MGEGVGFRGELPEAGAKPSSAVKINAHSTVILRTYTRLERVLVRANLQRQVFHRYGSGEPRLLLRGAPNPSEESCVDPSVIHALTSGFPEEKIYVFCDTPRLSRGDLLGMGKEPRVYVYKLGLNEEGGLEGYDDARRQYLTSVMLLGKLHNNGLVYFITRAKDIRNDSLLVNSLVIPGYNFITLHDNDMFRKQLLPREGLRQHSSLMLERREIGS
jgi:hypothetical protein